MNTPTPKLAPPATAPRESPTGIPTIPPRVVPWLLALYGAAVIAEQSLPPHTIAAQVAGWAVVILGGLGLASPGMRK